MQGSNLVCANDFEDTLAVAHSLVCHGRTCIQINELSTAIKWLVWLNHSNTHKPSPDWLPRMLQQANFIFSMPLCINNSWKPISVNLQWRGRTFRKNPNKDVWVNKQNTKTSINFMPSCIITQLISTFLQNLILSDFIISPGFMYYLSYLDKAVDWPSTLTLTLTLSLLLTSNRCLLTGRSTEKCADYGRSSHDSKHLIRDEFWTRCRDYMHSLRRLIIVLHST